MLRSINDSAATITTAASAVCGRSASSELRNSRSTATKAAPTTPVSWLLAFDCSATAVREPLVDTVAVSFGDYATSLFIGTEAAAVWPKLFASGVVLAMAALNVAGARGVDKAQSVIVVALFAVFAVFILATLTEPNPHLLAPSGYPSLRAIIASVALTFF